MPSIEEKLHTPKSMKREAGEFIEYELYKDKLRLEGISSSEAETLLTLDNWKNPNIMFTDLFKDSKNNN